MPWLKPAGKGTARVVMKTGGADAFARDIGCRMCQRLAVNM